MAAARPATLSDWSRVGALMPRNPESDARSTLLRLSRVKTTPTEPQRCTVLSLSRCDLHVTLAQIDTQKRRCRLRQ